MPIVKRLVRPEPYEVITEDGYRYVWPEGGEAVDVLEEHRRSLLSIRGAHLVEVEVVDEPGPLPFLQITVPVVPATVEPEPREPDVDLAGAYIDPATVEAEPELNPTPVVDAPAAVVPDVTDLWSDADKRALMLRLRDELGD